MVDKVTKMRILVEEIRDQLGDVFTTLPHSQWRTVSELDECLESARYWLCRLEDAIVASKLDD